MLNKSPRVISLKMFTVGISNVGKPWISETSKSRPHHSNDATFLHPLQGIFIHRDDLTKVGAMGTRWLRGELMAIYHRVWLVMVNEWLMKGSWMVND